jgi:hypothetical protein
VCVCVCVCILICLISGALELFLFANYLFCACFLLFVCLFVCCGCLFVCCVRLFVLRSLMPARRQETKAWFSSPVAKRAIVLQFLKNNLGQILAPFFLLLVSVNSCLCSLCYVRLLHFELDVHS